MKYSHSISLCFAIVFFQKVPGTVRVEHKSISDQESIILTCHTTLVNLFHSLTFKIMLAKLNISNSLGALKINVN